MENIYIVVSSDSSAAEAESVRHFISKHLSRRISRSTCFVYEDIRRQYDISSDEEKVSQFLSSCDCGIDFRNIFWIFLLIPDTQSEQTTTYCDPKTFLQIGKIIGQLISKTFSYNNQISFWANKAMLPVELQQIFGGRLRELESNYETLSYYVDSAERQISQVQSNFITISDFHQNKETISIYLNNGTKNRLNHDVLEKIITISKNRQICYGEINPIVTNDNREVSTESWIISKIKALLHRGL